ncbi:acyl-CoA thioesterase domain-containing protein [Actinomadura sp. KC345]|uniref:acyl-CoA thioesterase n=1 Tax=Actinomadura sp. KC345 TaxID=2530371 RepID=UPI001A9EEB44|nr:acyl-CoA thioesterase domain-containing protein [Actinomadura sp. KC345]
MSTSVIDPWTDLLSCLDLRGLERAPEDGSASVRFEGHNQRLTYHRLFGGQLLAQFVRAAARVCPEKAVKSLHALFPRAGGSDEPVRYEAERHHEGRTFATVTITARQERGVIATASVSLHAPEDGTAHQSVPDVPPLPGAEHEVRLDLLPWETRSVAGQDSRTSEPPEYELWMRTPALNAALAPAVAAYARPHPHRDGAAPARRRLPARRRHRVHVGGHLAQPVVPPAVPHRRLAAAAPAQPDPRARPLLRQGRRPHR